MTLQVSISVPGMIRVAYPLQGQTLSSHARLNGGIFAPDPTTLPAGTAYIIAQLTDPTQISQVTTSYQLQGKQYWLGVVTYYMDGNAVREVDYTTDEIPSYNFGQDYIPTVLAGEEIAAGPHQFTIVARFYSLANPGVEIYDIATVNFTFDTSPLSIRPYLDALTPGQLVGEIDIQMINSMLDYVLTQRTEGAVKNDIDFLANLYDINQLPPELIPYLAKTIGYDYFAGLLGDSSSLREQLSFLPDWQKSAGTAESILVLLRPLQLRGQINPLYLDLINNVLLSGVKQRYVYSDQVKVTALTKGARFTFPLTHSSFVPNTVNVTITAGGMTVFTALWSVVAGSMVCTYFHNNTGSPHVQWLTEPDGSDADLSNLVQIFADQDRGGITLVFDSLMRAAVDLRVQVDYQYEVDGRPGRNTRLSEFFDMVITAKGKPNIFRAGDYNHVFDIVKRSKPLRTKLRQITFPASYADAYAMNPYTVSSTGVLSSPDRTDAQNISSKGVQLTNLVTDSVVMTNCKTIMDGFSFSWENACDRWENRFGFLYSLGLDPSLLGAADLSLLQNDSLLRRGYSFIVGDDNTNTSSIQQLRNLRRLGFSMPNPKVASGNRGKIVANDVAHYLTIQNAVLTSPAVQTFSDLVMDLDDPNAFSPSNTVSMNVDVLSSSTTRSGFSAVWTGGSTLSRVDLNTGATTSPGWDTDTTDKKIKSFSEGFGTAVLTVIRFSTQAALTAFLVARPTLDNYQFQVGTGKWYGIWDLTSNFYTNPIHTSVTFGYAWANFQSGGCLQPVANVSGTTTSASFNVALGAAYKTSSLVVSIVNRQTQLEVANYSWSGGYWVTNSSLASLTVAFNPAVGGPGLTQTTSVSGTVTYTGSTTAAYTWDITVRYCSVGDTLVVTPTVALTDTLRTKFHHDGTFGVMYDGVSVDGVAVQDLYDLDHDVVAQTIATEVYFKGGTGLPSLTLSTIPPTTGTAMVYDTDSYDANKFYDTAPSANMQTNYLYFPKRIVVNNVTPLPAWVIPLTFHQAGALPGGLGGLVTGGGYSPVLPFAGGGFDRYSPLTWITTGAGQSSLHYVSASNQTLYVLLVDPIGSIHTTVISSGATVDLAPGGTYGSGFGYGTWYVYAKLAWPNATSGAGNFNGCLGQTDTLTFTVGTQSPVVLPVTAIDATIPSPTFTLHLGSGFSGLVSVPTVGPCYSGMSGFARWVPGTLGQDNPGLWGYQGGYYSGTIDTYGNVGGGGMISAANSDGGPPGKGNITGAQISIDVLTPPGGYGFYSCMSSTGPITGAIHGFSFPIALIHP